MRRTSILAGVLLLVAITARGQSATTAGGGEATGNGSVSYSVGQAVYVPVVGREGSVAAGVEQAYAITIKNGIDEKRIRLEADVYPNPTTDKLHLRIESMSTRHLEYSLIDLSGKTYIRDKVDGENTDIDMVRMQPGIYLLEVTDRKVPMKTFKIIKK